MSVACPHCGFTLALSAGGSPQQCPRCGQGPQAGTGTAPGVDATAATATVDANDIGRDRDHGNAQDCAAARSGDDPLEAVLASAIATLSADADASARGTAAPPLLRPGAARAGGRRHAPSFLRTSATVVPSGPRWPGRLGVGVLLLALASQLLLAQRNELAASARWRPVIGAICATLRCGLPPWRQPAAFTMLNRSVQPHPRLPDVLSVHASFRNDARWPQPWPTLALGLTDVNGRAVGQRAFQPREYRAPTRPGQLAPGQSASVRLDIIEPAAPVVAFTFDFQ